MRSSVISHQSSVIGLCLLLTTYYLPLTAQGKVSLIQLCDRSEYLRQPRVAQTLMEELQARTTMDVDTEIKFLTDFKDLAKISSPLIYVNYHDRRNWNLSAEEIDNFRQWLKQGGSIILDGALSVKFYDQYHISFCDYEATDEIVELCRKLFPVEELEIIPSDDQLYRCFYQDYPRNFDFLPSLKEYLKESPWPGNYWGCLGLWVDGRLALVITDALAHAIQKTPDGRWYHPVSYATFKSIPKDTKYSENIFANEKYELVKNEFGEYDKFYVSPVGRRLHLVKTSRGKWLLVYIYGDMVSRNFIHETCLRRVLNIFVYFLTH